MSDADCTPGREPRSVAANCILLSQVAAASEPFYGRLSDYAILSDMSCYQKFVDQALKLVGTKKDGNILRYSMVNNY